MKPHRRFYWVMVVNCLLTATSPAQQVHEQLNAIFEDHFAWRMREFPEQARARGDYSTADRITDGSPAAIERRATVTRGFLERLHAIDRTALDETDRLNYDLFEFGLETDIGEHRFRSYLVPFSGRWGPQQSIPQMGKRVRFQTLEDYIDYLKRLDQTPREIDDAIALAKRGMELGITAPKVTLEPLASQFASLLDDGFDPASPTVEGPYRGLYVLAEPFDQMPSTISADRQAGLKQRFNLVTYPRVREAISRLGDFVVSEYIPHARESIGAGDLPDGKEFYAFRLHEFTTTDMGAREIHELGLREVARIKSEMMDVIGRTDFVEENPDAASLEGDALFRAFVHYLRTSPRFYHKTARDLLMGYRDICKRVDAFLPKFFATLPRLPYGVIAIPDFMAPTQTTAYYQQGDIRNAEPGYFYANTHALDQRPKYEMISLAMHESVPGHHLQIALAQEMENVPEFRRDSEITVFVEGWGLYSERLGIEMGLYSDPYDNFGRLLYEMWRACRLVVDPGMHALSWSRERAVQFMLDNTALSELNINNEIDRYINWPGQATAYKFGELKIRELRSNAEKRLGEQFDIRAFHDVVLGAGAVTLDILERRVHAWETLVMAHEGE